MKSKSNKSADLSIYKNVYKINFNQLDKIKKNFNIENEILNITQKGPMMKNFLIHTHLY